MCFLHSWRNPAHEQAAADAVRARLRQAYVTASSGVLPQIKEFERFSTTVANAAVGPVIENYLGRLQNRLAEAGYRGELLVILSHGGVASVPEAVRLAAGTALSGPAGGVAAAVALGRDGRGARPDRLRHGRHLDGHRSGARRPARVVRRQDGGERAHRTARAGYRHAGCRRRIDRPDRPGWAACGGSGERRCRSGAGLLRPGRHRGDSDRREPGARLSRPGAIFSVAGGCWMWTRRPPLCQAVAEKLG